MEVGGRGGGGGTCCDRRGTGALPSARPSVRPSVLPLLRADNARRKRRFGQIVKMDFGNKRKKRRKGVERNPRSIRPVGEEDGISNISNVRGLLVAITIKCFQVLFPDKRDLHTEGLENDYKIVPDSYVLRNPEQSAHTVLVIMCAIDRLAISVDKC